MQLSKLLATAIAIVSGVSAAPNLFPVDAVGDIVAVRDDTGTGSTHIFYQNQNGNIIRICTSTTFIQGGAQNCGSMTAVTASEALFGTPLALTTLLTADGVFNGNMLFYIHPNNTLGEFSNNSLQGCTHCITKEGFQVVPGSTALYVIADQSTPATQIRVGFVSAGSPNTITEATFNANTNKWALAVLPN